MFHIPTRISGALFGKLPSTVILISIGWPATRKAKSIVSTPPWHGSLALTRWQMVSRKLHLSFVSSLKLYQPSPHGLRARAGPSATAQLSRQTLDAIEKDPIASLPPPKTVKPTIADLNHASEHDIVEHPNSVTCNRCGQRAPHRATLLTCWLKSPCLAGRRIVLSDGTHHVAPVPGQGRLRHQSTHPSHNCTFYPGLDTWICLTCGFYGSDVFKQLAQPCAGAANQAWRDKPIPSWSWADARLIKGSTGVQRETRSCLSLSGRVQAGGLGCTAGKPWGTVPTTGSSPFCRC